MRWEFDRLWEQGTEAVVRRVGFEVFRLSLLDLDLARGIHNVKSYEIGFRIRKAYTSDITAQLASTPFNDIPDLTLR